MTSSQPTASKIIAVLIARLGGGPVTISRAELDAFYTDWPTRMTFDEESQILSLTVDEGQRPNLWPSLKP